MNWGDWLVLLVFFAVMLVAIVCDYRASSHRDRRHYHDREDWWR